MKTSRKLFLLYVVLLVSTIAAFIPPLMVWVFQVCGKDVPPLQLLDSTSWVSMVTLVVSTYFGSNVFEKHVALSNGIQPSQLDNACMTIKGSIGAKQNKTGLDNSKDTDNDVAGSKSNK